MQSDQAQWCRAGDLFRAAPQAETGVNKRLILLGLEFKLAAFFSANSQLVRPEKSLGQQKSNCLNTEGFISRVGLGKTW